MDKTALAFLERLVATPSPSGFEQPVQKIVRAYEERQLPREPHGVGEES